MALGINTNIASLNVQKNLNKTQNALNTAIARLSSGLRINSAKDDAAGLSISDRMTSQINGLNQAVSNANDGISLAQTAEGALDEVTSNLQRMRELAVQASSSTNTDEDLESMQAEFSQLSAEISRISSTTTFNNQNILDGSFSGQIQVGANAGQTISISIGSAQAKDLGGDIFTGNLTLGSSYAGLTKGELTINGYDIGAVADSSSDGQDLADAINAQSGLTGVTAAMDDNGKVVLTGQEAFAVASTNDQLTASSGSATNTLVISDSGITGNGKLTIGGEDIGVTTGMSASEVARAINKAEVGVTASVDSNGNVALMGTDADSVKVESTAAGVVAAGSYQNTLTLGTVAAGTLKIGSANTEITLTAGMTASAMVSAINEKTSTTGVTATVSGANVVLNADSAEEVEAFANTATGVTVGGAYTTTLDVGGTLGAGKLKINSTTIEVTAGMTADQLVNEINKKTADTGAFASVNSSGDIVLNGDDAASVTVKSTSSNLTVTDTYKNSLTLGTAADGTLVIGGHSIAVTSTDTTATIADKINNSEIGVVAAAGNGDQIVLSGASSAAVTLNTASGGVTASAAGALTLTGTDGTITSAGTLTIGSTDVVLAAGDDAAAVVSKITAATAASVSASVGSNGNTVNVRGATGFTMTGTVTGMTIGTIGAGAATATDDASKTLSGLRVDTGLVGTGSASDAQTTLADISITSEADAATAISVLDAAISDVDNIRGTLGAVENRLDSTVSNLENVSENISAAKSSITDADYAAETANMTKQQILQQAGVAMLSQANQLPQTVLSLLQG